MDEFKTLALLCSGLVMAAGCGARSSLDSGAVPAGGSGAGGSGGAGGSTAGGFQLTPLPPVATGMNPNDVHVADFNGDGRLDVVVANYGGDTVGVYLGHGDGSLAQPATFMTGVSPILCAVADMNLDGRPDVVTADHGTLSVLPGDGKGALGLPVAFGFCDIPVAIASAEVTGDGRPDVIVSCASDATYVAAGAGDGTLATITQLPGDSTIGIAIGDTNADGALDIAQTGPDGVFVFLNNGAGLFADPALFPVPGYAYPVAFTDLNGDQKLDLAVGSGGQDILILSALLGLGNGSFQPAKSSLPGDQSQFLAAGDLDGDGRVDLVSGTVPGEIQVVFGFGDGTFSPPQTFTMPTFLMGLTLGDMNGDGRTDLVVIMDPDYGGVQPGMTGSVQVLLNTTP